MARIRRRKADPDLTKASGTTLPGGAVLPAGSTVSTEQQIMAAFQAGQLIGAKTATQAEATLPRLEPVSLFGPGMPVPPGPIDPVDPATGRPAPRQSEYEISWNLPGVGDKHIPWNTLRQAGDIGIIRRCIEVRKSQITRLGWDIAIKADAIESERESQPDSPDGSSPDGENSLTTRPARTEIESKMRDRLRPDIERVRAFWQTPDPQNGYSFAEWLGMVLEELLVLDALPIYPRRTVGGQLYGLEVIDGSTIKPLRDNRGMRPSPPNPAYQQILHGFPRGEFSAATDPELANEGNPQGVINPYAADSLIYKRRIIRAKTPYGFSPVEQCLTEINLWLKRQEWLTAEYDDGAAPSTPVLLPENSTLKDPAELRAAEGALNADLAGNIRARRRMVLMPPGATLPPQTSMEQRYRPDFDTFLVKLLCTYFDLSPTSLGFMETGGLGGSSYHEGQEDVEERKGVLPWCKWLSELINQISRQYLGMPAELEHRFLGLDDEDEAAADAVIDAQTKGGRRTINEGRDKLGLDRFDFPEADEPFIATGRQVLFLRGELQRQAELQEAAQALGAKPPEGEESGQGNSKPAAGGKPSAAPVKPAASNVAKAEELEQFARFAEKGKRARPFVWSSVDALTIGLDNLVKVDAPTAAARAREHARDARGRHPGPATGNGTDPMAGVPGASGVAGPILVPYRPGC